MKFGNVHLKGRLRDQVFHGKNALHFPYFRAQISGRFVVKFFAGTNNRLLSNHTGTRNLSVFTDGVENKPLAFQQLNGGIAQVFNADAVAKKEIGFLRPGILGEETDPNGDFNVVGSFFDRGHGVILKPAEIGLTQSPSSPHSKKRKRNRDGGFGN